MMLSFDSMIVEKILYKTTKHDIQLALLLTIVYIAITIGWLHYLLQKAGLECGLTCADDISKSILYEAVNYSFVFFVIQALHSISTLPKELFSYQSERLLLTNTAIAYIPSKTLFCRNKKPAWQVQLADITACTVEQSHLYELYVVLTTANSEKIVRYSLWKDPNRTRKKPRLKFSFKHNPDNDLDFPVIHYLIQHFGEKFVKVDIEYNDDQDESFFKQRFYSKHDTSFDLQSNSLTWKLTIAFFIIALYAIFDLVVDKYTYASPAPVNAFVLTGIVIFILVLILQKGKKIPAYVAVVLAALIGITSGLACYPAYLRMSSIASGKPESYSYQLQRIDESSSSLRFIPVDSTLPEIELRMGYNDYWAQFETGSVHEFDLVQNPFGLWLLDTNPIKNKALDFRRNTSKTNLSRELIEKVLFPYETQIG